MIDTGVVHYANGGWGFYIAGIEFVNTDMNPFKTRELARNAMNKCKYDMYNLMVKHGCCTGQDIFVNLAKWNKRNNKRILAKA